MCFCLDRFLSFFASIWVSFCQRKHSFIAVKATMFGPHWPLPFSFFTFNNNPLLKKDLKVGIWTYNRVHRSFSWNIIVKGSTLATGCQAQTHRHLVIYMNLHYRVAAEVTKGPKRQNETDLDMKAFVVFKVVILTLAFLLAVAPNKVCGFGIAKHSQRVGSHFSLQCFSSWQ